MTSGFKFMVIAFLLLFTCSTVHAQLCQGSLGDPIVNITFGSGANPGPQLSAAATNYRYVPNDCPDDGSYTVRNNTAACFGNSWHTLNADHTGNSNGYFMLVNASISPSAFYLDTVKGLCGNTTYEFAAWVTNVMLQSACNGTGIQPNLTFSIERTDGAVLQTYQSGDIPSKSTPVWQQFGFFFTTPASVSDVVLRIFNNAPGGCGNDLGLDDITFRPCGPKLTPAVNGNTSTVTTICQGTAKSLTFTCNVSSGFNSPVFQWQQSINNGVWTDIPGETTTTLSQNFPSTTPVGNYNFRLAVAEALNAGSLLCRIVSQPLIVNVTANPVTTATNSGPACEGGTLLLTASGGAKYVWTGVNNFSATSSPTSINAIKQTDAGKYYVLVTDINGCNSFDSTIVTVNPSPVAAATFTETTICNGDSVQLISSGGNGYSWTPATGLSNAFISNPFALTVVPTQYVVTVTNQFACTDTAAVLVNVIESPTANAGPDQIIIKGRSITLPATATGGALTYLWSPASYMDDPHILQPTVTPPADISYTITAKSVNGCGTATDTMHITVYNDIYIPTAFSPNGDGLNETWKIPSLAAFSTFELAVFNRYGQKVFENKNNNLPWDGKYKGKVLPPGAYVYIINLHQSPGILKGTVMIVK